MFGVQMFSVQMSLIVTHKSLVVLVRNGVDPLDREDWIHWNSKKLLEQTQKKEFDFYKWIMILNTQSTWWIKWVNVFAMSIMLSWPKHHWKYVVRAQNTSGGKVAQETNRSGTLLLGRKREKYLKQGLKDSWLPTKSI